MYSETFTSKCGNLDALKCVKSSERNPRLTMDRTRPGETVSNAPLLTGLVKGCYLKIYIRQTTRQTDEIPTASNAPFGQ